MVKKNGINSNNVMFAAASLIDDNEYNYTIHNLIPGASRLTGQTETYYTDQGTPMISTVTNYGYTFDYAGKKHLYPRTITTTNSDGIIYKQEFTYPQDATGRTDQSVITAMIGKNILKPVVEQIEYGNGTKTRTTYNYYTNSTTVSPLSLPVPQKLTVMNGSSTAEDRIVYNKYDNYGNLVHVTKDGLINVVYLWGQNGQILVAAIENATYSDVQTALGSATNMTTGNITDANINTLRANATLKNKALITSYKYKPLIGITEITDPRGIVTSYTYDTSGRLSAVKDGKGYYVTGYAYNLKNQ
jgi:YD repeat-containing protein